MKLKRRAGKGKGEEGDRSGFGDGKCFGEGKRGKNQGRSRSHGCRVEG